MSKDNISYDALTVSIVAAAFTGLQLYLQYENNRMSVIPKLDWRINHSQDDDFVFQIRLVNAGLGPAIVRQISATINGDKIGLLSYQTCSKIDKFLGLEEIHHKKNVCWTMDADEELYMRAGEEIVLYRIGPRLIGESTWLTSQQVNGVGLHAHYCSLYGDCAVLE